MKRAKAGMLTMLVVCISALSLNGCSATARPHVATTTAATSSPVASVAPCLAEEQHVRAVTVDGIDVQILGTSHRAVVVSNQSGQDLCGWKDLADTLVAQGDEVVLYDYLGPADDNAEAITSWMRSHGAQKVALLGGSQGAKASIIAAAALKTPPEALVALSAEQYLEGEDVAKSAAKLRCPTLFVTADHDPFDSTSSNEEFQKEAPPGVSTLTVVPGSDHGIQLLDHSDVRTQVFAFLAAHLGAVN